MEPTLRVHPQQALAIYAESVAVGARVALFGDASTGIGGRFVELGARSVLAIDPDATRALEEAARAPRGVSVRPYSPTDPDVRAADLAVVLDLGLFEDPGALIRRVRRMIGEEGVAIIAAKSTDVSGEGGDRAFDYYELFDLVAPEFESVRMVAQLPFEGVALVELGGEDESPSVSVDTQLAEAGRAPEAFIVVAGQREARLDPYSIVQLPPRPAPAREPTLDLDDLDADRAGERDALAQAQLRSELLASQLDDLRARIGEGERAVEAVSALEEALRVRSAHAAELERALSSRGRELAELSSEVEEMRAAAEAGRIAAAQVEEVALRADRAERRVTALEQELSKYGESHSRELAHIEAILRERAQAVRALEAELSRRDQMVRDLVGTLDELGDPAPDGTRAVARAEATPVNLERQRDAGLDAPPALSEENARLRGQLDALALDLARREGDAQATAWRIAELERQVRQVDAGQPSPTSEPEREGRGLDRKLAQALDELDVLRTALSQEHEARARAESGEELTRARAEIERQAVLMEQLVRQLGDQPPPTLQRGPAPASKSR